MSRLATLELLHQKDGRTFVVINGVVVEGIRGIKITPIEAPNPITITATISLDIKELSQTWEK